MLVSDSTDPVVRAAMQMTVEAQEWVDYARTCVEKGDVEGFIEAQTNITAYLTELAKHVQLTGQAVTGLRQSVQSLQSEYKALAHEHSDLQESFNERVMDMAQELTKSEVEYIMKNDDQFEQAQIDNMTRRMVDDQNPDYIADQEMEDHQRKVNIARQRALDELAYETDFDEYDEEPA